MDMKGTSACLIESELIPTVSKNPSSSSVAKSPRIKQESKTIVPSRWKDLILTTTSAERVRLIMALAKAGGTLRCKVYSLVVVQLGNVYLYGTGKHILILN